MGKAGAERRKMSAIEGDTDSHFMDAAIKANADEMWAGGDLERFTLWTCNGQTVTLLQKKGQHGGKI